MTTDAELSRIVRSWLEDGRTRLPDHVLDAVLADVPTTSQHRPWWPPRRIDMSPRRQVRDGGRRGRGRRRDRRHRPPATGSGWVGGLARRHFAIAVAVVRFAVGRFAIAVAIAIAIHSRLRALPAAARSPGSEGERGRRLRLGGRAGRERRHAQGRRERGSRRAGLRGRLPRGRAPGGAIPVRVAGLDGVSVEPYRPPVGYGNTATAPSPGPTRSRLAPGRCACS